MARVAKHGYVAYAEGCRCGTCTEAWRAGQARYREARAARLSLGQAVEVVHGRYSTYTNWGCRCGSCTEAARDAKAGQR